KVAPVQEVVLWQVEHVVGNPAT
ncbi:MAG: hypothetical protein H6Q04_1850, partial [Acidobacteria bacterium]|nr:hypothetical protein [Acidobacteriota bacterium]